MTRVNELPDTPDWQPPRPQPVEPRIGANIELGEN